MLKTRAFTLIELMVTLSICLLLVFVFSSFHHGFREQRLVTDHANLLIDVIQYSRTQALICQHPLVLRPLFSESDWSMGAELVEVNGLQDVKRLHEWRWHQKKLRITWHGFESLRYLRFASEMRNNALNGYFMIQSKSFQRKLILNRLGRVRMD